jgi:hypothetical protein
MIDGMPVSKEEQQAARLLKATRLGDEAWTKKFLANDFAARREMKLINLILVSEVLP